MPRRAVSSRVQDDTMPPPRRSARIQQQQQTTINPVQRQGTKGKSSATIEIVKKRKRESKAEVVEHDDDHEARPAAKKRSLRSSDTEPSSKSEKTKPLKRGVRFDDNEPLEALPDDDAAEEAAAKAAALSVSAEYLASRPENVQYASLNPRAMPCPPEAIARIEPSRTLDSKGRVLLQYPIRFVLAYRIEVGALYRYLKSVKRDFIDFQGTLLSFQLKIDEGLNMRHEHGLSEVVYMGRRTWTMIMSQSDRPETLPYPTLRIRKFQEIMGCTSQPRVYPYQPRTYRLKHGAK